jgi:hypothetical protein
MRNFQGFPTVFFLLGFEHCGRSILWLYDDRATRKKKCEWGDGARELGHEQAGVRAKLAIVVPKDAQFSGLSNGVFFVEV